MGRGDLAVVNKDRLLGVTNFDESPSVLARSLTRTDLVLYSRVIPAALLKTAQAWLSV
jgi:ABC-type uncharacterized transport system permease subunit